MILRRLFYKSREGKRTHALAREVEARAKSLIGLPSEGGPSPDDADTVSMLRSACLLLDRLRERQARTAVAAAATAVPTISCEAPSTPSTLTVEAVAPSIQIGPAAPPPIVAVESSTAGQELIRLRDIVLAARHDSALAMPKLLDTLDRQLAQSLTAQGITPLEDEGAFDFERHQVIETRATADPRLDQTICATVRPGYQHGNRLLRSQEVVVYVYEPTPPPAT